MKIVRIILGIILALCIAGSVMLGHATNVVDEAIRVKNVNSIYESYTMKDLITFDDAGKKAYSSLAEGLQTVAEGIDSEVAEKILNSESFINMYKDCTTQLIKYFRKDAEKRQSVEEVEALASNAVDNVSIENMALDADMKAAMKTVVSEGVNSYLDYIYGKADQYRSFNIFGLDNFSAFGNVRLLALGVGVLALILLIVDCWSIGNGLIFSGIAMILASIPFVLIGIGKESLIPFKESHLAGIIRTLFTSMSLPVMLWALVTVAIGFVFLIIGVSARLGSTTE